MNDFDFEITESAEKPQKRRSNATLKVMAMVAAVVVAGGGAGFGGAYLAGKSLNVQTVSENGVLFAGDSDSGNSGNTGNNSHATLNELQNNVGVAAQHTASDKVEYNSDGTYKYTRDLVSAVRDSVVYIEVYGSYRGTHTLLGSASGIIISTDGYIVTNNHVVEGCDAYTVKVNRTDKATGVSESATYDAKLCGTDADTDLAVIKIDAKDLPAAVLGDSDELRLGDDVIAIGNPQGFETSVSKGIISGLNRQVSDSARGLSSIQTDAALNSGNSGGALFNAYGEVVGVVNQKWVVDYSENLGFAITINEAKSVIDDLITKGYVSGRAILGITYINVTEYSSMFRGATAGWQVSTINENLPVATSGLMVGDTIVEIDGLSVLDGSAADVLAHKHPGDTVTVTVVRNDNFGRARNFDIEVELGESTGN